MLLCYDKDNETKGEIVNAFLKLLIVLPVSIIFIDGVLAISAPYKEVNLLKEDSLKLIVDEYYLKYMLNDILKNKTLKQRLLKKKYFIHVPYQFTRGYKYINEMLDDIGKNLGVDNLTKQFDFYYDRKYELYVWGLL